MARRLARPGFLAARPVAAAVSGEGLSSFALQTLFAIPCTTEQCAVRMPGVESAW
jgi:hypothetical protein